MKLECLCTHTRALTSGAESQSQKRHRPPLGRQALPAFLRGTRACGEAGSLGPQPVAQPDRLLVSRFTLFHQRRRKRGKGGERPAHALEERRDRDPPGTGHFGADPRCPVFPHSCLPVTGRQGQVQVKLKAGTLMGKASQQQPCHQASTPEAC